MNIFNSSGFFETSSNSSGIYEHPQQLNHHQVPAEHLHAVVEGEPSQKKKVEEKFEEETSKSF